MLVKGFKKFMKNEKAAMDLSNVTDIINSSITIFPAIIALVIAVLPLKIVMAVLEMILGIIYSVTRGFD
jgi:hypothetical protein